MPILNFPISIKRSKGAVKNAVFYEKVYRAGTEVVPKESEKICAHDNFKNR